MIGGDSPRRETSCDWSHYTPIFFFFLEGNDLLSEIAYILTILFVAIANILLLNVLIALFE